MLINEKELRLDIKEMLKIYNSDIDFTEDELGALIDELYFEVEDAIYQASSDVIFNYSNENLIK